ncbi:MAG: DUF1294 domain-containing protein [Myxococcales bacterium]|nr:DUF1294 domain-containing protein [Myxococcales bacterium]
MGGLITVVAAPWLLSYCIAVNVVSWMLCSYDKFIAGKDYTWPPALWKKATRRQPWWRVPELVLLGSALMGGSLGLWLGMMWMRHKTKKLSFKAWFVGIVILQLLIAGGWFYSTGAGDLAVGG